MIIAQFRMAIMVRVPQVAMSFPMLRANLPFRNSISSFATQFAMQILVRSFQIPVQVPMLGP